MISPELGFENHVNDAGSLFKAEKVDGVDRGYSQEFIISSTTVKRCRCLLNVIQPLICPKPVETIWCVKWGTAS